MQIYRVNSARDGVFQLAVQNRKLSNGCITISDGAPEDYNEYVRTDVKVYAVNGDAVTLQALADDLMYGTATKSTFKIIGNKEIYI
jgi:predicted amino acid dehydrogenase